MKKLLVFALTAALVGPAMAGGYMGVDVARTTVKDGNVRGTGVGVYGGYLVFDDVGIEFGYRNLFSETVRERGIDVKLKGTALQASLLAFLPLSSEARMFARLGVNQLEAKASVPGISAEQSDTENLFGIGLDYSFSKSTALRVEFQAPASGTKVLSMGVKFSF
jgi:hypothetical protein